jgi:hypothetical protein
MNADNLSKLNEHVSQYPDTDKPMANPEHQACLEPRIAPADDAPAGASLPILEIGSNKVTLDKSKHKPLHEIENEEKFNQFEAELENAFYRAIPCNCKSWHCPDCRKIKGFNLRKSLMNKASLFKIPRMFTITINRQLFKNPLEAYKYVMGKKFIARLLTKEMNIRRWAWVLEPQMKTGEGWPHWHILLDVGDLPRVWRHKDTKDVLMSKPENSSGWSSIPHYFDLDKAHRLLRKWEVGEQCYLSIKKDNFECPEEAINYITKYMIMMPKNNKLPEWMDFPKLKFFAASRDLGALTSTKGKTSTKTVSDEKRTRKPARKPSEIIADCKKKMIFSCYDSINDKIMYSKPISATKEMLKAFPGASIIQDFDFEKQRSYDIIGIKGIDNLTDFVNYTQNNIS